MGFFKIKRIGTKIRLGYMMVMVLMLAIIAGIMAVMLHFNRLNSGAMQSIILANSIQSSLGDYTQELGVQVSSGDLKKKLESLKTKNDEIKKQTESNLKIIDQNLSNDNIAGRVSFGSFTSLTEAYFRNIHNLYTQDAAASIEQIASRYDIIKNTSDLLDREIKKFFSVQLTYSDTMLNDINKQFNVALMIVIAAVLLTFLLSVSYALRMTGRISRTLNKLTEASEHISKGDLSGEDILIDTVDELGILGSAFNSMKNNLKAISIKVNQVGLNVSASALYLNENIKQNSQVGSQIACAIQDMAEGAEKQAMGTDQTYKALESIQNVLEEISKNSENAILLSNNSNVVACESTDNIREFIDQIGVVIKIMEELSISTSQLNAKTSQIKNITQVITGIADQTNLLALNAAIEAARAGEAGKGFAVVAEEVRKLADQSSSSANIIQKIISDINTETERITGKINSGVDGVSSTKGMILSVNQSLCKIEESNVSLSSEIKSISSAVDRALDNVIQVSNSSREISNIAQQSAAGSEEIAASVEEQAAVFEQMALASESLSRYAVELEETIKNLKYK